MIVATKASVASDEARRYVGLDVHKREITACFVDAAGRKQATARFPLTRERLQDFIQRQLRSSDEVALEATTNCWAVAEHLRGRVGRVVVSNPLATKAIAQAKIKTDKVDAEVLAQLLRCGYLPEVWQPDAETLLRRQLTARRASLVQDRTAVRNRIHSVLAMRLIETPRSLFGKAGRAWLAELLASERIDDEGRLMIISDLRLHDALEEEIKRFEQRLAEDGYRQDQVRLLMTLPGVDVTIAQALLAAFGDVTRFASAGKAASYLGLVPSTRQSAEKCYHGPITKRGRSQARWMLIQAAQHVRTHPGPLGHFFTRIKQRKNHNMAVVATARKLAMIAWHMLTHNEPYRYALPKTTETKLAKLRVQATGKRRRGGSAKGVKSQAKLPGGSRTIKSLDEVYAREGVPPRGALSDGERAMLARHEVTVYVEQITQSHVVPRKPKEPATQAKRRR
jgi:transposase